MQLNAVELAEARFRKAGPVNGAKARQRWPEGAMEKWPVHALKASEPCPPRLDRKSVWGGGKHDTIRSAECENQHLGKAGFRVS
ncbi:hypothetical protein NDU88_001852 [Pleurodeles waltl]|uniref:Uncharacterized protein n=1 Tax=Pleurodeles waltl TaxID=8319 RepID=A0AAV7LYV5_PLEWA|nr:hypothetical protein NDU88_001852 [Pleurodeles waltl]